MTRPPGFALPLATLAFVLSQGYLLFQFHRLRPNILVLQLAFDAERYWAILGAWGATGLQAYRDHFSWDFVHLGIYSVFGFLMATRSGLFAPSEGQAARRAAWMLPWAAAFDVAENLLQLHLLAGPFGASSPAIPLSALCSAIKWGLATVFALLIGWRVVRKSAGIGPASR